MKNKLIVLLPLTFLGAFNAQLFTGQAQITAFIYQGRFAENGKLLTGQEESQFRLWNAGINGSQIAAPDAEYMAAPVTGGIPFEDGRPVELSAQYYGKSQEPSS